MCFFLFDFYIFVFLFSVTLPLTTLSKLGHPLRFLCCLIAAWRGKYVPQSLQIRLAMSFWAVHVIEDFCMPSLEDQLLNCHGFLQIEEFFSWFYIFRLWDRWFIFSHRDRRWNETLRKDWCPNCSHRGVPFSVITFDNKTVKILK